MSDESLKHVPPEMLASAVASMQRDLRAAEASFATATDILEKLLRIVGIEGSTAADLPGLVENLGKVVRKLPDAEAEVARRCREARASADSVWVNLAGATNGGEAYDKILAWRTRDEDDAAVWHLKRAEDPLPFCGSDKANQMSTTIVERATCKACIARTPCPHPQCFLAHNQASAWEGKARNYLAVIKEVDALLAAGGEGRLDRIKGLLACEREATTRRWKESL